MVKIIFLFTTILVLYGQVSAQDTIPKRIYSTVAAGIPPLVDGKDDDECWNLVEWSGDFIQTQPEENKPPSQQTAFKLLYDNDNLYVFIRAYDTEPEKISRIMTRRDNSMGDMVEVDIDSYFDKQTAFSFTAMASGAKGDQIISQNGNYGDESWDPVWFLKTSVDATGWCAEMKIPLSQLRFGNNEEQIWGIEVTRHIFRNEERSRWQFIPKGAPGFVHLFGELHGIKNIRPKRSLELLPYMVTKKESFEKEEGNPFMTGRSGAFSAGLDGKAGITNDLTLDFTINPDFGQVEADPSEVNLSAFETYFSEKRPFFVEGKNIFDYSPNQTIVINNMQQDNLFYSRRIGRAPQYYPQISDNEYVRMPEASTILGSAKLSGKTKKGVSIGILESITTKENAVIDNGGIRRKECVEPLTSYFAGRFIKDFNKGETKIGGMITAVNRDIEDMELITLPTSAYTGGIDFEHSWKDRTWYFSANTEFSMLSGDKKSILELQRSSARYYQRPDAGHLGVDTTLTSLSGFGGTVKLGRSSQKRIQFETSLTLRSPGLELNDIGYMRYSDLIHHGSWVAYYIRNPFAIFNNFYLNTNYWMYWDFSGRLLSAYTNMNFNTQFKNRWRLNGSFTREFENISTSLLRGGPSFVSPGNWGINMNVNTDQSKKMVFNLGGYQGIGDENSSRTRVYWGGLTARPLNSISFSISPEYITDNTVLQYITTSGSPDGTRYVFGELDMRTMSLTFRLNYTIRPELTVEYYGQPFVSAGKYSNFCKIADPGADRYTYRFMVFPDEDIHPDASGSGYVVDENNDNISDFTFANPDFNFRQFRSNLVVRWEYLPGSTIYLVWSQGRTSSGDSGLYSYRSDIKELFNVKPHNVFLLKFSYWFTLN